MLSHGATSILDGVFVLTISYIFQESEEKGDKENEARPTIQSKIVERHLTGRSPELVFMYLTGIENIFDRHLTGRSPELVFTQLQAA